MQPDANGQSVNTLQVRVNAEETQFLVNGTVVHTTPKSGMTARTDGIYGVRINHVIPGVRVESNCMAFMAGYEEDAPLESDPPADAPVLRINGLAIMAGIEVRVRRPGEDQDRGEDGNHGRLRGHS